MTVKPKLAETIARLMVLAEPVFPTLIAEFLMEDRLLANHDAKSMEPVDLARSTLIALRLFLTVEVMEVATLALPLENPVVPKMVVKMITNKIAIL